MLALEQYRPTPLESAIVDFYNRHHIRSPQDIDLEMFAYDAAVNIKVTYLAKPSATFKMKNTYFVTIDDRMPYEQQRVELAHELGHILHHVGRQEFMPDDFKALQEWQADKFAAYALVPTFMLENFWFEASSYRQLVSQLAYHFDVPEPFMDGRLRLLDQRMQALQAEAQMAAAIAEDRARYDYSYRSHWNPSIEYLVKDNRIIGQRRRALL